MEKAIKIVDTTMRDGEQRPGIALTIEDKIKLAQLLDRIGVYEIEAGIPSIGVEDEEYFHTVKELLQHAKMSVWSRVNEVDVKKAIACKPNIIHIAVPVSYVHIYSKLKKNKVWIIKQVNEYMEMILSRGIDVTIGFEDASRADEGFLIELARIIKENGGNTIRIADTVGVLTPTRTRRMIENILERVDIEIEFHAHNDLGMSIANSIASVKAGATYVDCTLFGIGERSGNCDLRHFVQAVYHTFPLEIDKVELYHAEITLLDIFCKKII